MTRISSTLSAVINILFVAGVFGAMTMFYDSMFQ